MKRFEWDKSLETGDAQVDEQHRMLFSMGSEFNATIMSGGNTALSIKLIENLANYAVQHFKCEEAWMQKAKYPELSSHTILHEDLKRKLVDRLLNIKNGRVPMTAEMSIFLHDWITHHILEQDLRAIHWCTEHA